MKLDLMLHQVKQKLTNLSFPENWCQGRTAFGGLSAAMLYTAMREKVDSERDILSLSTNFVGPLLANIDFDIQVTVLRQGKNATQVEARAIQNGQVSVIALGSFAIARESKIKLNETPKCVLSKVNPEKIMPYLAGITPSFFQHMNFNIKKGAMPFSASKTGELAGWMQLKEQPEQLGIAEILALTDAWPPAQLQMYLEAAPASSMSWYIEFLPHEQLKPHNWLAFEAFTHHATNGYACEEANIFNEAGDLIAMSRQTVALFN